MSKTDITEVQKKLVAELNPNISVNQNQKLIEYIKGVAIEKGISTDRIAELLESAIYKTFKKPLPDCELKVKVDIDKGTIKSWWLLTVVDCALDFDYDDFNEIPLIKIKEAGIDLQPGDIYEQPYDINTEFTRPQATQTLQVFRQSLIEIQNEKTFEKWSPKIGKIVYAEVEKEDEKSGYSIANLNYVNSKYENVSELTRQANYGFVGFRDKIPNEKLIPGQRYKFLIKDVKRQTKGWPIILSRADADFIKELLTLAIPDIQEGIIVIEKSARIPGFKTKLAVSTTNNAIDPAMFCVGPKGSNVINISNEVHGEKIDIVNYSPDLKQFIINACGRDKVVGVVMAPEVLHEDGMIERNATVIVKVEALPAVIGKGGTNIKLIAKIVQCNIDIKTVDQAHEEKIEYDKLESQATRRSSIHNLPSMQQSNDEILESINNMSEADRAEIINVPESKRKGAKQHSKSTTDFDEAIPFAPTYSENNNAGDIDLQEAFKDELEGLFDETNDKDKED